MAPLKIDFKFKKLISHANENTKESFEELDKKSAMTRTFRVDLIDISRQLLLF